MCINLVGFEILVFLVPSVLSGSTLFPLSLPQDSLSPDGRVFMEIPQGLNISRTLILCTKSGCVSLCLLPSTVGGSFSNMSEQGTNL